MRRTYGLPVIFVWTILSLFVFLTVDAIATRPVEIHVEELRGPGKTDEQVLMEAVQLAHERVELWWWIHDGNPVIVLDSTREYRIDPALYRFFDVPVVKRLETGRVLLLNAVSTLPQ